MRLLWFKELDVYPETEIFIFNRYGEQVFATANPGSCWDGTYKGKPALAGGYVYDRGKTSQIVVLKNKGQFFD
ncbi:MAG: gliding motility-associated C-terminal domain-containing protein [Chitinophagaceae bacterium]|nr:gliding motility-associated C-terminal domain-containing protein [Chitinophagaceae bacterium]